MSAFFSNMIIHKSDDNLRSWRDEAEGEVTSDDEVPAVCCLLSAFCFLFSAI
jgi:hypothetical protein